MRAGPAVARVALPGPDDAPAIAMSVTPDGTLSGSERPHR
jgi:hypothetical protein